MNGISFDCPRPKAVELLDDAVEQWGGACPEDFTMPGKDILSSSQPEDVEADDFPIFGDSEQRSEQRNSFASWTEYAPQDPRLAPNRLSHELSNRFVEDFLLDVQDAPWTFRRLIRELRGDPEEISDMLLRVFGCTTASWPTVTGGCPSGGSPESVAREDVQPFSLT
eukprot:s1855_g12.t1